MAEQLRAIARKWLYTTNHKEVGILYLITSIFLFVAAGVLALTMRTQLSAPGNTILAADIYNQLDTVLAPNCYTVHPDHRIQPWSWCPNTHDCFDNNEFHKLPSYHAQDESAGAEVEVHVGIFLGHPDYDLLDALRVSIIFGGRCSALCRQGIWDSVLFLNPGRITLMGQRVLVLWAS